jgi:hypothetical protein
MASTPACQVLGSGSLALSLGWKYGAYAAEQNIPGAGPQGICEVQGVYGGRTGNKEGGTRILVRMRRKLFKDMVKCF